MSGSVAIWYERNGDDHKKGEQATRASLKIHINFWRHFVRQDSSTTYLDIGLMLGKTSDIENLYIYLPMRVTADDVKDLGNRLEDETTLNAIFNSVLTRKPAAPDDKFFFVSDKTGEENFTCHRLDIKKDCQFIEDDFGANERGTIISFQNSFCSRLKGTGDHYLRIRIELKAEGVEKFIQSYTPADRPFLSSFLRTEIIEFRLNERRNYPSGILDYVNRPTASDFQISLVNYFLIRDFKNDYVLSHKDFRKMRRLEKDKWRAYLGDELSLANPDRMFIYQWKEVEDGAKGVQDFIALAIFRLPWSNIWGFIAVALLLGIIGNAAAALGASELKNRLCLGDSGANLYLILGIISLFLIGLLICAIWKFFKGKYNGDSHVRT